ncbi:acyltransferase family protein [Olegusella massiliensis]|uniref:acyltransferase family protein n=1 Tax=Olegusella massiliensis TaxID=1776381 RepID=UPI0040556933
MIDVTQIPGQNDTLPHHSYGLDLLKASAAFLIVLHHLQQDAHIHFQHFNFYGGRINFGFLVELFFIVSGFLLLLSEQRKRLQAQQMGLVESFIYRWERIWPMAALSILAYIPLCWAYKVITGSWIFGQKQGLWSAISSLFLIFAGGISRDIHGMNNPTWYLCVLLICYALFYISLWLSHRLKLAPWTFFTFLMLLGIGARSFNAALPFLQSSSQRGYASFFLGVLLAEALPYLKKYKQLRPFCTLIIFISATCLATGKLIDNQWAVLTFVLYPALVILLYESKLINSILKHPIVSLLGASSYAVYLWHTPLELFAALVLALSDIHYQASLLSLIICALAIELFGIACHQLVEKQLIGWTKTQHSRIKAALK